MHVYYPGGVKQQCALWRVTTCLNRFAPVTWSRLRDDFGCFGNCDYRSAKLHDSTEPNCKKGWVFKIGNSWISSPISAPCFNGRSYCHNSRIGFQWREMKKSIIDSSAAFIFASRGSTYHLKLILDSIFEASGLHCAVIGGPPCHPRPTFRSSCRGWRQRTIDVFVQHLSDFTVGFTIRQSYFLAKWISLWFVRYFSSISNPGWLLFGWSGRSCWNYRATVKRGTNEYCSIVTEYG